MNILFDSEVFASQLYGGVSRIFFELITRLLAKNDLNISLFQGLYINRYPLRDYTGRFGYYWGQKVPVFPHAAFFLKPINRVLFRWMTGHLKVDIFHPTAYSVNGWKWKKSGVVITVNDMIPETFPEDFRDLRGRLRDKQKCIERADKIIAISENTKHDLLQFYTVDEKKIQVIYPGVPANLPEREKQPVFSHRGPYILYVGTRKQGYKNFHRLLEAYAVSPRVQRDFDLVCFGGPAFNTDELKKMEQLGCREKVFHVAGDDGLLGRVYTSAAVFVCPSLAEGFGLPPLEAMRYGCPVAVGRVPVMMEVAGDGAAYFNPYKKDSIAATLESVLFNPGFADNMVKKGYMRVKKYSWRKMTEDVYRLYRGMGK